MSKLRVLVERRSGTVVGDRQVVVKLVDAELVRLRLVIIADLSKSEDKFSHAIGSVQDGVIVKASCDIPIFS